MRNSLEENMPLGKNADAGDYVTDFQKSKAPQFKGKSKEKRRKMAIAAYLDAKDKKESKMKSFDDLRNNVQEAVYTSAYGKKIPVTNPKMMSDFKKAEKLLMPSKNYDQGIEFVMKGMKISKPEAKKMVDKLFGVNPKTGKLEAVSPAQQAAIAIAKKEKGEKPKEEQMTPAQRAKAMADFKKRGGKITKLAPGKAQGYHGRDDPGKDMRGMLDKPDTKKFKTRKKIKSLGASMKSMRNMGDMGKMDENNAYKVQVTGPDHAGVHSVKAKSSDHAHQMVMKKIGQSKLPKHMQPKTRIQKENYKYDYGSPESIKLMKKITPGEDTKVDELAMYTSKKTPNLSYPKKKTKHEKEKARLDMMRKNKQKGESVKEETNFAVSIEGLPDMFMTADSPGMLKQTLRKIVKQPSMIQSVKRVTDAMVKKTFRLKAQGRDEEQDENVNELSYKTMNQYAKKSKADTDRATNSAVATIMRKGDHSKDLDTMRKRKKGMSMAKNRVLTKLRRGDK